MSSGSSSRTALGAAAKCGCAGSAAWHMAQRLVTIAVTSSNVGRVLGAATVCTLAGPAFDSQTIATTPAATAPQVHHGDGLPAWRALKKWRIGGPIASTIAKITQLKRVAKVSG